MQQHKRPSIKMLTTGISIGNRNDLLEQGKFQLLKNIRSNGEGLIKSRPTLGIPIILSPANSLLVHSIKTIVDKFLNTFTRIAGAGDSIYSGNPIPNFKASGFSGLHPLSIVDFRPEESIAAWAYIADDNKMVKISSADVLKNIGLIAPRNSAEVKIAKPERKVIDEFDNVSIPLWTNGGLAAAPTVESRLNTTISAILFDEAAPSFASIVLAAFPDSVQAGMIVDIGGVGAEEIIIDSVFKSPIAAGIATISKIIYDSGASGLCTISASQGIPNLEIDSILLLNGTEYIRILDIIPSLNNSTTFRCKTIGTFAATNTLEGKPSIRAYLLNNHLAGVSVSTSVLKSVISGAGISTLTRVFNVDLTTTGSRPISLDDILHFSMIVSDISKISEVQIQMDIDQTTNDFTRNFYMKAILPNFFANSINQTESTLTVQQQALQRSQIQRSFSRMLYTGRVSFPYYRLMENNPDFLENFDNWNSPTLNSDQTSLGQGQYSEFFIPLKEFIKVGTDQARTLKDIKAIRISINCKSAVDIFLDALWVGGSFELSNVDRDEKGNPYNWIYCYQSESTKEVSDWSPFLRNGLYLSRGRIRLKATPSSELSSTDRIIWARFGGSNNDFRIIGNQKNDNSEFIDEFSDSNIARNSKVTFGKRKPFCFIDAPKKGTCDIYGNKVVRVSGDSFNTTWAYGSQIVIDNIPATLYNSPLDGNNLELDRDLGSKTGVEFYIPEALLTGQNLPIIFGTFGQGQTGLVIFGLGNKLASGTVYWLDPNLPDTMNQDNFLEITSPSEPLMNGVVYFGVPLIWSTEGSYQLSASFVDNELSFKARANTSSKGLFARYAFCLGSKYIYFLSNDGIYKVEGIGNPQSITDRGLRNLFPSAGFQPTFITLADETIIYPPDFSKKDDLWFYYANGFLYFRFIDINNSQRVLVYDENLGQNGDWISYDDYEGEQIGAFYSEEGNSNNQLLIGTLGKISPVGDDFSNETSIKSQVFTPFYDLDDSRLQKLFSDIFIDFYSGNNNVEFNSYYNNKNISDVIQSIFSLTRDGINVEINNKNGIVARTIAGWFRWNTINKVFLYEFQPAYIEKSQIIRRRVFDLDYSEELGSKYYRGIILTANTFGQEITFDIFDDEGNNVGNLTVNHSTYSTDSYKLPPIIANALRLQSQSPNLDWEYINHKFIFDSYPEFGIIPTTWSNGGTGELKWLQGFVLTGDTEGKTISFQVQGDNEEVLGTFEFKSNKLTSIPFDFNEPKLTHLMRIVPEGNIRIFGEPLWKFDIEVEPAFNWVTEEGSDLLMGYSHIKKMIIELNSVSEVELKIFRDGDEGMSYFIPSTGGKRRKIPIYLDALKSMTRKYDFFSEEKFRLYKNGCEVYAKSNNSPETYKIIYPFGGIANKTGAEI